MAARMINARSETVDRKPAFREAFRLRRCLVPANGFFEWKRTGRTRQPYYFSLRGGGFLAFAGLWESWQRQGVTIDSCTVLTTEPNALVQDIHDRMPVILSPASYRDWLNPKAPAFNLKRLLRPFPADDMICHPVSRVVNSPANDSSECIEALGTADRKSRFPTLFD